tara:strand:- start:181 stop:729 length:549 start_codon:yes stop_codon:yes gene_type:complete
MKIISGKFGGRSINIPKKLLIRPTTNICRHALFNILTNMISFDDIKVLDIFSGSGFFGYECASRGAKQIDFLEKNYNCIKFIKATSLKLKINHTVFSKDFFKFVENFTNTYDLVFADPPYKFDDNKYQTIINYALNNCLKNDKGIFILEHYKKYSFSENNNLFDERSYGDSKFSFFKKKSGI